MRRFALPLALILATVPQGQAQTSLLRSLDTDYAAARWKAVGRIDFGPGAYCSGTLIAPDLVLTAAHCLYRPGTDQLWAVDEIRFRAGLRGYTTAAVRTAQAAEAHVLFDPVGPLTAENVAHDVALIKLTDAIATHDIAPFAVAPDGAATGPVSVVSYGQGRDMAQSLQKQCQMMHRVEDAMIFDCDVTSGSSGAPVFSDRNGRAQVMAVISGMIEIDGQRRAVGMALGQRIAELKSQMNLYVATPKAKVRRITAGNSSARHGIGAKFVKP